MTNSDDERCPENCAPRRWILLLLVLALLPTLSPGRTLAARDVSLDGRLGGSLASFETRYGPPVAGNPQDGADFELAGIGVIFAQFQFAPDPANPGHVLTHASPESRALVLTIHPKRSAAAAEADPADWSLAEAQKRLMKVLPTDVVLDPLQPAAGRASQTCASAALAAAFAGQAGCRINYVRPTAATVSYVTVALALAGAAAASPANPCAGAVAWSQATGARLQQAQGLLDQVAALGDDAAAPAKLSALAARFAALAEAQRQAPAPAVMTVASERVAAALAAYAAAVAQAGSAVAAGDAAQVDAAVAALNAANDAAGRAAGVITRALAGCGLQPGATTPAATPTT